MKLRIPFVGKNWRALAGAAIVIVGAGGYILWQTRPVIGRIPTKISDKLLFTPYAVSALPAGFHIDKDSFTAQEVTLIFTASNNSGQKLFFSEQAVPKNVDTEAFYGSTMSNPERLEDLKFKTIFGKLNGQDGNMTGITTDDNTWILVAMPKQATKADAQIIERGLRKQ